MANVIRSTTPTFKYTFKTVQVNTITAAYLTIAKNGIPVLERDLDTAVIGDKYIAWTLTQQETLGLASGTAEVMVNWKTAGGTRGASLKSTVIIEQNLKSEVI